MKRVTYLLFFLSFLYRFGEIHGDYRLEIRLDQYQNPSHRQANGDCCNHQYLRRSCTSCHSKFVFCVVPFGEELRGMEWNLCKSRPSYATAAMNGDGDDLSFQRKKFIDQRNDVPNPLVFTGNGSWPGSFQFRVRVTNWGSPFSEQMVDEFVEDWEIPLNSQNSRRKMFGVKRHAKMMARGHVTCTNGLLCKNCTKACDSPPKSPKNEDNSEEVTTPNLPDPLPESPENEDNPTITTADLEATAPTTESQQGGLLPDPEGLGMLTGNEDNSTGFQSSKYEGVVIGISVVGILVLLAVIVASILLAVHCVKKQSQRRSEIQSGVCQPFLHHQSGNNADRYQSVAAVTDDDSQDEMVPPMDNPTYGDRSSIQSTPIYAVPKKLRVPHATRSGGGDHTAGYSVIMKRDMDSISPAHSLDDIPEASEAEEMEATETGATESGYHVITRENMDGYVSEAGLTGEEEEEEGVEDEEIRGLVRKKERGGLELERSREVVMSSENERRHTLPN